ncbi:MAG: HNH endonuclease [Candidatus Methanomethylophilaceae archaeon]
MVECPNFIEGQRTNETKDPCPVCGKRHASLKAALRCSLLQEYRSLTESVEDVDGSVMPPFPHLPNAVGALNLWPGIRKTILERDGHRCRGCGDSVRERATWLVEVHHIIPRVEGGGDHPSNLETLCAECHRRHTTPLVLSRMPSTEEEWEERRLNRKFREGRDLLQRLMQGEE